MVPSLSSGPRALDAPSRLLNLVMHHWRLVPPTPSTNILFHHGFTDELFGHDLCLPVEITEAMVVDVSLATTNLVRCLWAVMTVSDIDQSAEFEW